MEAVRAKDSSRRQKLIRGLKTWWRRYKSNPPTHQQGLVCAERVIFRPPPSVSTLAHLNTSSNMSKCQDVFNRYPDAFTKSLADEGLLTYSNPVSKIPVLSVCHGFLNAELLAFNSSYLDERRYKKSIEHLSEDKQENYLRLFSAQYPLEPLVDGLPGSVWLECVEPTLCILKALHSLKRRKSNLSLRKCAMSIVDSSAASHGDFEHRPHVYNHLLHGQQQHRLVRMQFLALEGVVLNLHLRNNQNDAHELQEGRYPVQPAMTDAQRRRRFRQYRPYDFQDLLRGSEVHESSFQAREIANYDYAARRFRGI